METEYSSQPSQKFATNVPFLPGMTKEGHENLNCVRFCVDWNLTPLECVSSAPAYMVGLAEVQGREKNMVKHYVKGGVESLFTLL
jgi:hypothetical protein